MENSIELAMGSEVIGGCCIAYGALGVALRGSIVDIYPLDQEYPLRVDFFDTEVDSIRAFNAERNVRWM